VTTAKTVLVADDTAFVRDRFKTAIEAAGHRALTVKSAAELLARVRTDLAELDLIVLDLRLPHASGLEVVRNIRKMDDGRLPILVFSGTVGSVDEVRQLAALGVAGYVNEYSAVQHILPSLAPHLFPDEFDRRDSPRVVLGIPIAYRFGNTIAAALTLNLSHGGIAIRTTSPLAPDAKRASGSGCPGPRRTSRPKPRCPGATRKWGWACSSSASANRIRATSTISSTPTSSGRARRSSRRRRRSAKASKAGKAGAAATAV
jgi:two-component system, cell cycle response regulator DivK